ncbi:MAG: ATP-dependent helicase [Prevotella sp.]
MTLEELNKAQQEAVTYIEGPQLVIAGAGSGKTRVLTYKIAYLLSRDVKPWNILALTFTNKAAQEMRERIASLIPDPSAQYLTIGTFHSVFAGILRREASRIGYTSQFTIYDDSDSRSLLKTIVKEMELDEKQYRPSLLLKKISRAKNNICLPAHYAADASYAQSDKNSNIELMPQVYAEYERRLRQSGAMDFDDLLLKTYLLLKEHDDVRNRYGDRFRHVLVDEYQDTNSVQQNIVSLIVRGHNRITVVGDDAQSIYAFRGADINNILTFGDTFSHILNPDGSTTPSPVRTFKLEQNYRSTQTIVNAANSLISHNRRQIHKAVYSENERGEAIRLYSCHSDKEEAATICSDIRRRVKSGALSYKDIAILYRTNAQSRTFEEAMARYAMPYRIIGGLSFYQRKEIKDIIAYFRLVVNNHDEEALRRVINYPARGIGSTTLQKILSTASRHGVSPWNVVASPAAVSLGVSKAAMVRLDTFASMIRSFSADAARTDAATLADRIIRETGLAAEIFRGDDIDDKTRQENVGELRNSLTQFVDTYNETGETGVPTLTAFLQEISLMTDLDNGTQDSVDNITLMTIHAAKGLEFNTVYIVGVEDQIIPADQASLSPTALEEERRLMYVAMTRARKRCVLSFAETRYRYGRLEYECPSRFLFDIDTKYMSGAEALYPPGRADTAPAHLHSPASVPSTPPFAHIHKNTVLCDDATSTHHRDRRDAAPASPSPAPVSWRRLTRVTSAPSLSSPRYKVADRPMISGLEAGKRIEHSRFGRGTVVAVDGVGENTKARVEFDDGTARQLLLKYAKVTILE